MGKTYTVKTPSGDFKVINYYHNKRVQVKESQYLIPTYSWTLTPNTQLDLFYNDNFPFDVQLPSTWLTNCADPSTRLQSPNREGCWLQSSSIHPHEEDQENAWSQNPMVHIHNNFFRRDELGRNFVSGYKLLEQTLVNTCATCIFFDGP